MFNLIIGILILAGIMWAAKKFYFPMDMAQHPERYPIHPDARVSRKDLAVVLSNLQRWRKEGKITREEYDRLTDISLSEMQQLPNTNPSEIP